MNDDMQRMLYVSQMRAQGKHIAFSSALLCPHCGRTYHVDMRHGASRNHCSAVACKLAHSGAYRILDNVRRLNSYYAVKFRAEVAV